MDYDENELVEVQDTDWYKETVVSITPGENLRAFREKFGMTQAQIGEKIGGIPSSTAAGTFQILEHFFDFYTKSLDLDGTFSKDNQRAIAHQYFRECHALADIVAGNFLAALSLVRTRWASLPDSGNNQHENSVALLKQAYLDAGGMIA